MTHAYAEHQCYPYQPAKQNYKKTDTASPMVTQPSIATPFITKPSGSAARLLKTISIWMQRSRQRKHLAQLDKHLLDDIGLTEEMAAKEIAKPFWNN